VVIAAVKAAGIVRVVGTHGTAGTRLWLPLTACGSDHTQEQVSYVSQMSRTGQNPEAESGRLVEPRTFTYQLRDRLYAFLGK
jgi:hypothetical protein